MQPKLSQSKYNWIKNRSVALNGKKLNYNVGVQREYQKKILSLVRRMTNETERRLIALFKGSDSNKFFNHQKQMAAQDDTIYNQSKQLVNELNAKFKRLFNLNAKPAAEKMVDESNNASAVSLSNSLEDLSGLIIGVDFIPKGLLPVMNASIAENVSLIKSIPEQYFKDITGSVMRSITTGNGLSDLLPVIQKYNGQIHRKAKNIALDQTRKAYNNINKQRMMAIGYKKFKWLHSGGGQHPRKLHQEMSGNIYSFNDLPIIDENTNERGIPGQAINCGCTMTPIYEFNSD